MSKTQLNHNVPGQCHRPALDEGVSEEEPSASSPSVTSSATASSSATSTFIHSSSTAPSIARKARLRSVQTVRTPPDLVSWWVAQSIRLQGGRGRGVSHQHVWTTVWMRCLSPAAEHVLTNECWWLRPRNGAHVVHVLHTYHSQGNRNHDQHMERLELQTPALTPSPIS